MSRDLPARFAEAAIDRLLHEPDFYEWWMLLADAQRAALKEDLAVLARAEIRRDAIAAVEALPTKGRRS